eukprot:854896-Prorocentrum_lima.AAC.1
MRCVKCPTFKNVWKVVSSPKKEVLGFFMVYVDDVIMFGSTSFESPGSAGWLASFQEMESPLRRSYVVPGRI